MLPLERSQDVYAVYHFVFGVQLGVERLGSGRPAYLADEGFPVARGSLNNHSHECFEVGLAP